MKKCKSLTKKKDQKVPSTIYYFGKKYLNANICAQKNVYNDKH